MSRSAPGPISRILARRPGTVLVVVLIATALCVPPASHLRIASDLEAMLPRDAPAADAYRSFLNTFGGIEKVFVTIRLPAGAGADPDRLADAAETLADALSSSKEVRSVRSGLDPADEEFAAKRIAPQLPLLLDGDPAAVLAPRLTGEGLAARAASLKDAASGPGAIFLSRVAAADPLGLSETGIRALAPASALPFDPVTGALLSKSQRSVLVIVTPARAEVDAAGGRALLGALEAAYAAVRKEQGSDLQFDAIGGPLYAVHDEQALQSDLIRILTAASFLVLGMIVLAFEGFGIPTISILAVAIGQIWCAALVASWLGEVTAVGVGFAAILLGLGDDFTIHLGARFRESWQGGRTPGEAMEHALSESGPGITAAALTTAAAFAVLGFAHFRPLRELGIVVASGVVLLLLATIAGAGPMLVFLARVWKRGPDRMRWRGFSWMVTAGVRAGSGAPRASLAVCGAITLVGLVGLGRAGLDTDLRRLRPTDHPAARAEGELVAEFGVGLDTSTIVVPGATVDEALDRADAVAGLARAELPAAQVSSPSDWIVSGARLRSRLDALAPFRLDDAATRLSAALDREGLDPKAFAPALDAMRAIGGGRAPEAIPRKDWPDWIADDVRDSDAGVRVAVRIRAPEGAWPAGPPASFLAAVEAAAPGAQVANAIRLGHELRSVAVSDLKRLGVGAVLIVLAIVLISYRGAIGATALTFLPVVLGTVWTAGLWGLSGLKFDLFSLCVLPVMVGIGVDDGLHVLHLARQRGEDLEKAALDAGRGVVLTNLTTCAGFASLAVSHVPALRNGGILICVGNLLCLAATLVVLPAVAALRRAPARPGSGPS